MPPNTNNAAASAEPSFLRPFVVKSSRGKHFPYLDGFRGLAILMVLIFHSWVASGRPRYPWRLFNVRGDFSNLLAVCFSGVQLFFVLSGFLLSQSWLRADFLSTTKPNLQQYFRLRWFRIVPGYYCALGFWVLFFIPFITPSELFYSGRGLILFLMHALMLENFLPISAQYNPTWWTMSVETLFYILLPFVMPLFVRLRWILGLLICLTISFGWISLSLHPPLFLSQAVCRWFQVLGTGILPSPSDSASVSGMLVNQLPSYCLSFGFGIALANLYVWRTIEARDFLGRILSNRFFGSLCFIGGAMITLGSMNHYGHDLLKGKVVYLTSVGGLVSFGFTLLLAGILFGAQWMRAIFSFAPLRLMGLISYSAYLWHLSAVSVATSIPAIRDIRSDFRFPVLFLQVVFTTTMIGSFFYLTVEKPFLVASRHRN